MKKIGIVTVTYNSERVIEGFLESALQQTYSEFVLYVVDNASHDATVQRVQERRDARIRVVRNAENTGAAEGNNDGIRAALSDNCDAVLFINNDVEFGPSLLQTLLDGLEEHRCDMIAPKILFFDHPDVIWSAGGGFYPSRGYASYLYGHGDVDNGQFDHVRLVENAPTTCLLVRTEVFTRVGLLDSRYFAYVEDTDFCFRANQCGIKLLYYPRATVLHKEHSLTGGLMSDFMMRYTTRNRVYFMLKHLGLLRGMCYVPAYQMYILLQFLSRKVSAPMFWVRQKALFEGLRVWRESAQ